MECGELYTSTGQMCNLQRFHVGSHESHTVDGLGKVVGVFRWQFSPAKPTLMERALNLLDGNPPRHIWHCGEVYEPMGTICELPFGHVDRWHVGHGLTWADKQCGVKSPDLSVECLLGRDHYGLHYNAVEQRTWNDNQVKEKPVEDDLKMCKNKRCGRYQILIQAPGRRYCSSCSAKLKNSWGHSNDSDNPPLLDPGPDTPPTNGMRGKAQLQLIKPSAGGAITATDPVPANLTNGKLEPLSWNEFKGNTESYVQYRLDFQAGKITDNEPFQLMKHSNRGPATNTPPLKNDTFTCESADVSGCPVIGGKYKDARLIRIPHEMYRNWIWLALYFNTEWIAYLRGAQDEASKIWTISDMYFPKQKANGAHVDAEDGQIQEGTIGSVHSHVNMGAFFSGEDEKHFNHPVEIVVNRKGELAMCVRMVLDCGKFSRIKTECVLIGTETAVALATDLESKLTKQHTQSSSGYYHGMH